MFKWFTKAASAVLNMRTFSLTDSILGRLVSGGQQTTSGKTVTVDTALQLSAVWACVRLIAGTIATLPLGVFARDSSGNKVAAFDHPLYPLLHDQPNADMTAVEFWECMVACLLLWGNAYARRDVNGVGMVVSLTPLPPDRVSPRRQSDGSILYVFTPYTGQQEKLTEDEIFHIKGFSLNGLLGLSPISYARNSLGLAMAADEMAGKFFASGMTAAGFVETGGPVLTEDQRTKFEGSLEKYRGSQNLGKIMLLEGGFKFNQLTINPDDAQLLASRQHSVEEICRWFQTDPSLIGHYSGGHVPGSALEQQMMRFTVLTLRTWLSRIEQTIHARILTPNDRVRGIRVEFSVEGLLRGDSAARAALYGAFTQNGIATRDWVRAKENMPKYEGEGGDMLTVQSNLVPLEQLGKQPAAQTPEGFGLPTPAQAGPAKQPERQ